MTENEARPGRPRPEHARPAARLVKDNHGPGLAQACHHEHEHDAHHGGRDHRHSEGVAPVGECQHQTDADRAQHLGADRAPHGMHSEYVGLLLRVTLNEIAGGDGVPGGVAQHGDAQQADKDPVSAGEGSGEVTERHPGEGRGEQWSSSTHAVGDQAGRDIDERARSRVHREQQPDLGGAELEGSGRGRGDEEDRAIRPVIGQVTHGEGTQHEPALDVVGHDCASRHQRSLEVSGHTEAG